MASDENKRDSLAIDDARKKPPPRDRDQSAYSPARAERVADKAEFPDAADTPQPSADETLIGRDNLKGTAPGSRS